MDLKRVNYSSGSPLEEKVGYSRMVKVGPMVLIGGTTSVLPDGSVYGENDVYEQAKFIFEKQINLLKEAGGTVGDVVSVRAYVTDDADKTGYGKAYTEFFHDVRPCNMKLGINRLNRPTQLVEIELTAVIGCAL
ncbi:MAG: Rid family hydrolase [Pygmaiobacter sp.]